jgi:hypothetical protein
MGDLRTVSHDTPNTDSASSSSRNSPRHAVQLAGIEAHALRRVYGQRGPRLEQVGRALVLDQRGIFGRVVVDGQGSEVGFFW